ncbi:hypothetical protein VE03_05052 [Pseudogymnoascus sp. 23342-1-I1]|nr:hypothetical protein VE03_05052 [Pseudogymnoascus sp. 23342-1-I1]
MDSPYLPQELIDLTISHIEDHESLASVRLVSSPCRRSADPLYFKRLCIVLSTKSIANVANLIQSPYRKYVEEIQWADKELQEHLKDDLKAFQSTFKKRLAGLSRKAVAEWHGKYRTMYADQEFIGSMLYAGDIQLNLDSFVNLKRVSVNNGCELGSEQYPAVRNAREISERPAQWSSMRQLRPKRGGLYAIILKSLAGSQISQNITHFSLKTEGSKWDDDVLQPNIKSGGPPFMFENIQHLDINLCLREEDSYEQRSTATFHLRNRIEARNLQSLTIKIHPHAVIGTGNAIGDLDRPLTELECTGCDFLAFGPELQFELCPQLRHLELHNFSIDHFQLREILMTLLPSLRSLILSHCVFKPCLIEVFTTTRENNVVPHITIFKHSRDSYFRPVPEKPKVLTEAVITPYLLGLGMSGTLSIHDWNKQVKEYADQNSGYTGDT